MHESKLYDLLRLVIDPELVVNIVDLGLVYGVEQVGEQVLIRMTLTTPACPFVDVIIGQIESIFELEGLEAKVQLVFDPVWNRSMIAESVLIEKGLL